MKTLHCLSHFVPHLTNHIYFEGPKNTMESGHEADKMRQQEIESKMAELDQQIAKEEAQRDAYVAAEESGQVGGTTVEEARRPSDQLTELRVKRDELEHELANLRLMKQGNEDLVTMSEELEDFDDDATAPLMSLAYQTLRQNEAAFADLQSKELATEMSRRTEGMGPMADPDQIRASMDAIPSKIQAMRKAQQEMKDLISDESLGKAKATVTAEGGLALRDPETNERTGAIAKGTEIVVFSDPQFQKKVGNHTRLMAFTPEGKALGTVAMDSRWLRLGGAAPGANWDYPYLEKVGAVDKTVKHLYEEETKSEIVEPTDFTENRYEGGGENS